MCSKALELLPAFCRASSEWLLEPAYLSFLIIISLLPPGEIPGAPELEVGAGMVSYQEVEQCQRPKAEITAKLCPCCSQRERGKAVASLAPKFPWLWQEEKGWDPRTELSGTGALSCCTVRAGFASSVEKCQFSLPTACCPGVSQEGTPTTMSAPAGTGKYSINPRL